jgi:hypothetical protein
MGYIRRLADDYMGHVSATDHLWVPKPMNIWAHLSNPPPTQYIHR